MLLMSYNIIGTSLLSLKISWLKENLISLLSFDSFYKAYPLSLIVCIGRPKHLDGRTATIETLGQTD